VQGLHQPHLDLHDGGDDPGPPNLFSPATSLSTGTAGDPFCFSSRLRWFTAPPPEKTKKKTWEVRTEACVLRKKKWGGFFFVFLFKSFCIARKCELTELWGGSCYGWSGREEEKREGGEGFQPVEAMVVAHYAYGRGGVRRLGKRCEIGVEEREGGRRCWREDMYAVLYYCCRSEGKIIAWESWCGRESPSQKEDSEREIER